VDRPARAAIAHDWFYQPGGGENVALELADLLPQADVYTSFADRASNDQLQRRLRTWPLQRVVGPTTRYRYFLPLYPLWFGTLDLRGYQLVVSSCSGFAKGVRTSASSPHLAYIHTPLRYAWQRETYLSTSSLPLPARAAARVLHPLLRRWDRAAARRPDLLIANSGAIQRQIHEVWGLDSEVIYPPVRVDDIEISDRDEGFLLVVSRVVAYRRLDLVVDAARRLDRTLVIAGDGPELPKLRAMAGPSVRFLGRQDRAGVKDLLARCHAYVVPGDEPFGIAPVEAMAAGKPVVGFRGGGVAETVLDGQTGVLFDDATPESMAAAIERLDSLRFDPARIRARAEEFSTQVFRRRFVELFRRLGVDPTLYRADLA
jgi:glycosyltransferase involved in cell wall biosynthesis